MGRTVERMRAVGARRGALLLVVAVLAAAIVYVGGREAGVGERSEAEIVAAREQPADAAQQGDGEGAGADEDASDDKEAGGVEPLTLRLSAPLICEARYPKEGWGDGEAWWYWESAGTTEVSWTAAGGDGSYTVTILGETYSGATGTAEVSCALEHGLVSTHPEWGRIHAADDMPLVDSGPKTINATVADGSGATATSSVNVYSLLNRDFGIRLKRDRDGSVLRDQNGSALWNEILEGGKTYRIDGILMTVPSGIDLQVGEAVDYSPGPGGWDERCCTAWSIGIVGSEAVLFLYETVYEEHARHVPADDPANTIDADRVFDEFLASFGQPPKLGDD